MGRCRDTHPSGRTMRTSTRGACSTGYTCALLVARRHSAPQPCHSQPGRGEAGLDLGSRGPGLLEPTDLQRAGCVGGRDGAHASGRPEVRALTQLLPRLLPLPALRCVARPAHSLPLAIRETGRWGPLCVHDAVAGRRFGPPLCTLSAVASAGGARQRGIQSHGRRLASLAWVSWACRARPREAPLQRAGTAHCQQQLAQSQGTAGCWVESGKLCCGCCSSGDSVGQTGGR